MKSILKIVFITAALAGTFGCATLKSLLSPERPTVKVEGAELTDLTFDGAEVTVALLIENPNPVGIAMSGFSYELFIDGNSFLGGDIAEPVQIEPMDSSSLEVPVAFEFRELLETVRSIGDSDETSYAMNLDLRFELPILGPITVPVRAEGMFPVPRKPEFRLAAVSLDAITLLGADLTLEVVVTNPNRFGVSVRDLEYAFSVDGNPWVEGREDRQQSVPAGRDSVVSIPFSVRFLSVGRTVGDVLRGADEIDYSLNLEATVGTDMTLIPSVDLPVSLSGTVQLRR